MHRTVNFTLYKLILWTTVIVIIISGTLLFLFKTHENNQSTLIEAYEMIATCPKEIGTLFNSIAKDENRTINFYYGIDSLASTGYSFPTTIGETNPVHKYSNREHALLDIADVLRSYKYYKDYDAYGLIYPSHFHDRLDLFRFDGKQVIHLN